MMVRTGTVILLTLVYCGSASALEPDEILIIANKNSTESKRIARYYCSKRRVPDKNILALPLGANLNDTISRNDYEKQLAEPIRKRLLTPELLGTIRCLLTTYGVPIKVSGRGSLKNQEGKLRELKESIELEQKKIEQLKQDGLADSAEYKQSNRRLAQLQLQIALINGKETNASVDSELSMVLFESYDLYRWQPNMLKNDVLGLSFRTLMVSRLDGPDDRIATGLIDKAMEAEKTGLKGIAYIDSRGIVRNDAYGHYDQSLRDLAILTGLRTKIPVKEERTAKLFAPGTCRQTAIYCGWYSLKKYVDAFEFVDGAIGYHIASFEAVNLRDPNSSQWCPSMLRDGITATLGAVSEPYLHSFPEPRAFFAELYQGHCLVEAYYHTKPFNSWQLLLIGDPLYKPFENNLGKISD
ncbi:MAG TPA: TIGR03790 family protein [Sedimentisphaerales bacterium]|nr:TIGR03790 family protein [Sedimentisphaerales bacterium]